MRTTRDDMSEMHLCHSKARLTVSCTQAIRANLSGDVEAFLAAGGVISQIPTGLSGESRRPAEATAAKGGGAFSRAVDGSLGLYAAAAFLRIDRKKFRAMCDDGKGPPYYMVGQFRRFLQADLMAFRKGAVVNGNR